MFEEERIVLRLQEIEKLFNDLEIIEKEDPNLEKIGNYHGFAMILFSIINNIIDIMDDIITLKNLGTINMKYKDLPEILFNHNFISKETKDEIKYLVTHRNLLAHQYGIVNKELLFDIRERIEAIYEIIHLAKEILKESRKKS